MDFGNTSICHHMKVQISAGILSVLVWELKESYFMQWLKSGTELLISPPLYMETEEIGT